MNSLKILCLGLVAVALTANSTAQNEVPLVNSLEEIAVSDPGVYKYWLDMGSDTYGNPIRIPVLVFQGSGEGPTLGLTAAIHGNELNGIPIIHKLVAEIDVAGLNGRIIAIPGLNAISIQAHRRRFPDEEDLNRNFPGKVNGNRSQQYVFKIKERILPVFDFHIDMHTASFGRVNSFYARADLSNDTLRKMAELQSPDIILNSTGAPSFGPASGQTRTMRAEAGLMGIPSITVEYGNPQVYQRDMTDRGTLGILRTLGWLNMYESESDVDTGNVRYCKKSYWIYMQEGGFLEVDVALNDLVSSGQVIARVKDAFGTLIRTYTAPEAGVVIGKSSNPANMEGGRIIHLGILRDH